MSAVEGITSAPSVCVCLSVCERSHHVRRSFWHVYKQGGHDAGRASTVRPYVHKLLLTLVFIDLLVLFWLLSAFIEPPGKPTKNSVKFLLSSFSKHKHQSLYMTYITEVHLVMRRGLDKFTTRM